MFLRLSVCSGGRRLGIPARPSRPPSQIPCRQIPQADPPQAADSTRQTLLGRPQVFENPQYDIQWQSLQWSVRILLECILLLSAISELLRLLIDTNQISFAFKSDCVTLLHRAIYLKNFLLVVLKWNKLFHGSFYGFGKKNKSWNALSWSTMKVFQQTGQCISVAFGAQTAHGVSFAPFNYFPLSLDIGSLLT